jgi:hypothetical protein
MLGALPCASIGQSWERPSVLVTEFTHTHTHILQATEQLADAIAGVQEALLDKLAAITSLWALLLGKELPPEPAEAPVAPTPVTRPVGEMPPEEDPLVIMWDLTAVPATGLQLATRKSTPLAPRAMLSKLAMIKDNDNNVDHPSPPISICRHTRNQFVHLSHACPTMQSQLRAQTAHMINCVIAAKLMPLVVNPASAPPTTIGYAFAAHQLAIKNHVAHHFIGAIIDNKTSNMLKYRHLVKKESTRALWETSFANKIGGLFQGTRHLKGTNTCFFICKEQVPLDKWPTYGCICCNFCPQKEEQHCTRLTVGGNRINYPSNKATPTTDLTTAKLLINSTISMPGLIFLGIDLPIFTSTPPYPIQNTCASDSTSSQRDHCCIQPA